ncbi:hypothetical protein O1L44_08365 [Streptomyces noursei]|nr:hypothetical protein [Streptomyces noursei]
MLWLLADHLGLAAGRTADVFSELAAREEPLTVVVPDVDLAGPVRAANEPARLVREVLVPLAATPTVHLLADVPRELAAELAGALPRGQVQVIDLDAPEWADPEGLVLHAETALTPEAGAPDLPFTTDPDARRALAEALARRADGSRLTVHLAVRSLFAHPEGSIPPTRRSCPAPSATSSTCTPAVWAPIRGRSGRCWRRWRSPRATGSRCSCGTRWRTPSPDTTWAGSSPTGCCWPPRSWSRWHLPRTAVTRVRTPTRGGGRQLPRATRMRPGTSTSPAPRRPPVARPAR